MNLNPTYKRVYDYRIREAVCASGNPNLFPELDISRSTALSWIRRGCPEVVALDEAYRHLPLTRLALLAQRLGKVFASPTIWARLTRERAAWYSLR